MHTDKELIQHYVKDGSEGAFKEVVDRHVALVYGAALRQLCGNDSLAQEVTQSVFTTLAAKAPTLCTTTNLAAWLYTTTRFTVSHVVRAEHRRQNREQIAYAMQTTVAEPDAENNEAIPPRLIDEVLESLNEADRGVVLLRFFEGQPFAAISAKMNTSEDAVRMRLSRALEKARGVFARNGINSSAAAVSAVLANQATAAPLGLAASVSHAALISSVSVATSVGAKMGITALMTTTKGTLILTGTAVLIGMGIAGHEYREAQLNPREAATMTHERDRLGNAHLEPMKKTSELSQQASRPSHLSSNLPHALDESAAQKLVGPVNARVDSATNAQTSDAERMARMRPLLEAGMPIKGAVVFYAGDKVAQHPVEFVMGKETRIEGDDGTYSITPSLNDDGTVMYQMILAKKEEASGQERVINSLIVIDKPWGGFTVGGERGKVFAFDPDDSGP